MGTDEAAPGGSSGDCPEEVADPLNTIFDALAAYGKTKDDGLVDYALGRHFQRGGFQPQGGVRRSPAGRDTRPGTPLTMASALGDMSSFATAFVGDPQYASQYRMVCDTMQGPTS
jgi:hypothetical protein